MISRRALWSHYSRPDVFTLLVNADGRLSKVSDDRARRTPRPEAPEPAPAPDEQPV